MILSDNTVHRTVLDEDGDTLITLSVGPGSIPYTYPDEYPKLFPAEDVVVVLVVYFLNTGLSSEIQDEICSKLESALRAHGISVTVLGLTYPAERGP